MLQGLKRPLAAGLLSLFGPLASALAQPVSLPAMLSPTAELQALKDRLAALEARLSSASASSAASPAAPPAAPAPPTKPEPFAFGDFTWQNGNNRQPRALLDSPYLTGGLILDANYTFSFNRPIDHTIVGSTVTSRHNELNLVMVSAGADFHHENVRATLSLQYGSRANLVQGSDGTVLRGQYRLSDVLKYIREANFGYHFDVLYGLNIDVGIFMSYIGMSSFLNFENWNYQSTYTADNTPYYLKGLRIQIFPTERLKIEVWVVNGWQSYANYGESPGGGVQVNYRPREWISYVSNDYFGFETRGDPGRARFHTDNTVQLRYLNRHESPTLSRAAAALTLNYGFEHGGAATIDKNYYFSVVAFHRMWFYHDVLAWTLGGSYINNPGRYLLLLPPDPPGLAENDKFQIAPGLEFSAWEFSSNFDWLPNQLLTYRLEYVYRGASVPYFNGPGGITAPDGYVDTAIAGFRPDRVTSESRLILALLIRM